MVGRTPAAPTPRWIARSMAATDVGFLGYWIAVATAVIPAYPEPVLVHWNWSFLVLDVLAALTGLCSLRLLRAGHPGGRGLQAVSLALTHAAGLNAIMFWALRGEFDPAWWLPNLWLVLFPVAALVALLGCSDAAAPAST
jgi:hypothetical protein